MPVIYLYSLLRHVSEIYRTGTFMAFKSEKYDLCRIWRNLQRKHKKKLLVGVFMAVTFFIYNCGDYNYSHISEDAIVSWLYELVIPTILIKERPNCVYEHVLQNNNTIDTWNIPKYILNDLGIDNGSFSPIHCNPLFSVAILVTHRNRQEHLDIFLPYIHTFLKKQNIHYKIYLIEQQDNKPFNKGLLYNLGARQALADGFPCLILHDVDLLPLSESNLYACTTQPRHLSASIDKFRFVLLYNWLVGGVLAILTEQYVQLNGFSNRFMSWGGEDGDFYLRMKEQHMTVIRFPRWMSRYKMLPHAKAKRMNANLFAQMYSNQEDTTVAHKDDGLHSARAFVHQTNHQLFTLLAVQT